MRVLTVAVLAVSSFLLAVANSVYAEEMKPMTDAEIMAKLATAAPAQVVNGATIMGMEKDMKMRVIRKGTNGYTCMLIPDPMCADNAAMAWAGALLSKKAPPKTPGFMYMLAGDTGASNTDPYATAKTADNHWIQTGSHVMITSPGAAMLKAYPSTPDADPTKPYVMWPGTPYAHLMMPVK